MLRDQIVPQFVSMFYGYINSGRSPEHLIVDPRTERQILARDYFVRVGSRSSKDASEIIKPGYLPPGVESIYILFNHRSVSKHDVNVSFGQDISMNTLDTLVEQEDVKVEKIQNDSWYQYKADGLTVLRINRDLRRAVVYPSRREEAGSVIYTPNPIALKILNLIYARRAFSNTPRENRKSPATLPKGAISSINPPNRDTTLTIDFLGQRHMLETGRRMPRRR